MLITTGSQGEPMSALTRMAISDHRQVEVSPDDFIIISARPIPGNEKTVGDVVNELMKRGCDVVYESYVRGPRLRPRLPGGAEADAGPDQARSISSRSTASRSTCTSTPGLADGHGDVPSRISYIGDIGGVVEITRGAYEVSWRRCPPASVLVDGLGVGDVGSIVLRDRKHLGQDGLIVVVATIDSSDGHVVSGPDIVSRGFVYVRESEPLMDDS